MGFRFRKSINFGKHFRVNLSSKGIGYSYGVKGYRHTVGADGKERITTSIPGTGISHVENVDNMKSSKSSRKSRSPVKGILIFAAVCMCLLISYTIYDSSTVPTIPPPPEENVSVSQEEQSYFDFGGTQTVFVTETKTEHIKCRLTDVSPDEIIVVNDNEDIADVKISEVDGDIVTLEVNGIVGGEYSFFELQSEDGTITSEKLCVVVDELYPNKTTAPAGNGVYIVNTSNGTYHLPGCSFLPESENSKIVFSRDDAKAYGGSPCGHCNP